MNDKATTTAAVPPSPTTPSSSPTAPSPSTTTSAPPTAPFDLQVHFSGPFVFSVKTENNSTDPSANLASVEVYAPVCGHSHAATVNGGTYMLESHWHCIHPAYSGTKPAPLTLGQLKTNVGANTPWTTANRPILGGWELAFALPFPPNDWRCDFLVPTNPGTANACFSGQDADVIPSQVAIEQILTYKQVLPDTKIHGVTFPVSFNPVGGVVSIEITSESPYIPTKRHERRAVDAIATLLGLDLLLENALGPATSTAGFIKANRRSGGCSMGIISAPSL
jgi:hypothetical protein